MTETPWFAGLEETVRRRQQTDEYAWIRDLTDAHRQRHHCWAYPYADGSALGAIAAAIQPVRVLELGTALGYTACWWAHGGAQVDTIENDAEHVRLARDNVVQANPRGQITVLQGDFFTVLGSLTTTYDLAFFDGYEPPPDLLALLERTLGAQAVVVTTNLDLGSGRIRASLTSALGWETHFLGDVAVSVRT